ncbi:hypothetical protein F5890DRAFT_1490308 [Lentinula detonsa]|uniref:RanBD1 domain-containing protein n=1 Tax=Lentinula detonsa TaxID=2804962 RepID=A0AA38Q6Q7_9AGAR|nr:hypothetical protein F5890DRAFT_1490308 [Lentinula detonsa]
MIELHSQQDINSRESELPNQAEIPKSNPVFGTRVPTVPDHVELSSSNSSEGAETQSISRTVPAEQITTPDQRLLAVARGPSLKRKQMHDHDENNVPLEYPHNLAALYPNKRCKTPPESAEKSEQGMSVAEDSVEKNDDRAAATSEVIIKQVGDLLEEPTGERQRHASEEPALSRSLHEPLLPVTSETGKKDAPASKPPAVKKTPTSQAFAFEGFATATPASFSFNNGTLASGADMRPTWSSTNSFRKRHSFVERLDDDLSSSKSREPHALGLNSPRDAPTYTHVTGEEDEDVQCELKGVKLFVKRGSNDYSSGILGQVKYLLDKRTLVQRLLFRREPLWKISMNTRLQPTVRCTFDPQECILRLLLAESLGSKASGATEIVVYALKPGRFCSRKDFQKFAESVIGSSSLKTTEMPRASDEGSSNGKREI